MSLRTWSVSVARLSFVWTFSDSDHSPVSDESGSGWLTDGWQSPCKESDKGMAEKGFYQCLFLCLKILDLRRSCSLRLICYKYLSMIRIRYGQSRCTAWIHQSPEIISATTLTGWSTWKEPENAYQQQITKIRTSAIYLPNRTDQIPPAIPPLDLQTAAGPANSTTITRDECIALLKFLAALADLRQLVGCSDGLSLALITPRKIVGQKGNVTQLLRKFLTVYTPTQMPL